jgi:uncharacterized membrane protein
VPIAPDPREDHVFDTIANLPLHPLVVHAVIVLLPLSALGAVLVAIKADWNRRFGFLVIGSSLIAAGSSVVAKESGEVLASRVGYPADHAQWGKWIVIASGLLFLSVSALWWLDRTHPEARTGAAKALAAVQILIAVVALVFAVLAGHSGAQAVWGQIVKNTQVGRFPSG